MRLLLALAEECGLRDSIAAMFRGKRVNFSDRTAGDRHVALRMPRNRSLVVQATRVAERCIGYLIGMSAFSERVRSANGEGHTGKPIKSIVNIGIGGSDLGPVMAY